MNFSYIFSFYSEHYAIFMILLLIGVVIEWPVIIFSISLLATKLGFGFWEILAISFWWDIAGDIMYFHIWKYIWYKFINKNNKIKSDNSDNIEKIKNDNRSEGIEEEKVKNKYLAKIDKAISEKHIFETLLMIKYTPPITLIWLMYLWYKKIELKKFILWILPIIVFNSLLITSLWYFFWKYFINTDDFYHTIIYIFCGFGLLYFITKLLPKIFTKNG